MKTYLSKIIMLVMVINLTVLFILVPTNVEASTPKLQKQYNFYCYKSYSYSSLIEVQNPTKKGKITKLKSVNKDVASVKTYNNYEFWVEPHKEGETTISFKYAGKTLKSKITVREWVNPCKNLKIAGQNYANKFNESPHYNWNNRKKDISGKIEVKAKSGWKILGIKNNFKKVKNKGKVKLEKWGEEGTGTNIMVLFQNKKTKEKVVLFFGYSGYDYSSENIYESNFEDLLRDFDL